MSEETTITLHPISHSASGKLNGYIHSCQVVQTKMYYAACLARIDALPVKGRPSDWEACAQACRHNQCAAKIMREEELLKGHAIYFRERGALAAIVDKGREWVKATFGDPKKKPAAATGPSSGSVLAGLDAMSSRGGYAGALTAAAAAESSPAPSVTSARAPITALPGETPLQMARRLAAAKVVA